MIGIITMQKKTSHSMHEASQIRTFLQFLDFAWAHRVPHSANASRRLFVCNRIEVSKSTVANCISGVVQKYVT